ncbi:MAG: hypothetical protein HYY01_03150 [Chloroflexi bacterium]|nr:hypothetical protein [Chloroflexota bacterium]
MRRHLAVAVAAAALLLAVYLGIITLAQGWSHALGQTLDLWYWVVLLAAGFGTQAGLYSFIRQGLRESRRVGTTASVAASGGVSTGSMAACCAHHLSDVLPALGLAGVATFLTSYQTVFILAGVLSNLVGITIMLEAIQRHGLSPWVSTWPWNMRRVKLGAIASSAVVVSVGVVMSL